MFEIGTVTWVEILNESICVNTHRKGMNPTIEPQAEGT